MRTRTLFLTVVWMFLGAGASAALAQGVSGALVGTVKDDQGAVIPGATVSLTSETRNTAGPETLTNEVGEFTFVNLSPDTYTVSVTLTGFTSLKRTGITIRAGDRISLGALALAVGSLSETVMVAGEAPMIQASSGERSYTATDTEIENLPLPIRAYTGVVNLAPGVVSTWTTQMGYNAVKRIGSNVNENNYMIDGVSTMDPGSNRPLIALSTEAIEEVRVAVSGYQAEFGRATGLQITATTKSGTNQFRGSFYDVERSSDWNANSKTNLLNGDPKPKSRERDIGFTIGGPVGKSGGSNKIFFFYAQEFGPRTAGGGINRYRVPTALERAGDFSRSMDQTGTLYPYIKDPQLPGACSAANQSGCFAADGVLGRIPADRLYSPTMAILNWYPQPNIATQAPGQTYNLEVTQPEQSLVSWQPTVRVDYQPTSATRVTFKSAWWAQQNNVIIGTLPGFNDTIQANPLNRTFSVSANYNLNPTTFIEAVVGTAQTQITGCGFNGGVRGTGAEFCQVGLPANPASNMNLAGFGTLPMIFPDANVLNPDYYAYDVLHNTIGDQVPAFDAASNRMLLPPTFAYGSRIATANQPPNAPYPSSFNINQTMDIAVSVSKLAGQHTLKAGYSRIRGFKAESGRPFAGALSFANDTPGTNPFDTSFGFANAAIGSFSSYTQPRSLFERNVEFVDNEGYIQDTWKIDSRLTLDYGLRFVHQSVPRDLLGQQSNWSPEAWSLANAPRLYVPGCANGVYPCPTGTNRQAMDPQTGQFMGPTSAVLIGTIVPGTGSSTNGVDTTPSKYVYSVPSVVLAPRFGFAYDVTGNQNLVVRGGAGIFYQRRGAGAAVGSGNPPINENVTLRFAQLNTLNAGLAVEGVPAITASQDQPIPTSTQWSTGVQMLIPGAMMVDIGYMGNHNYNDAENWNLNSVNLGAAYLAETQDPTRAASAVPGANVLPTSLITPYRGFGNVGVLQQDSTSWSTFHGLQFSLLRRMRNGFSFGFNETLSLYSHRSTTPRLQVNADGTATVRADQALADEMLGTFIPERHVMKANFVWDLPDLTHTSRPAKILAPIVNGWQWSGVWTGTTGGSATFVGQAQNALSIGSVGATQPAYSVDYVYANGGSATNLTGSPNFQPRVRIVGDPGSGCSDDPLRQFNTAAFQGPVYGSDGLESGDGYLFGCFQSAFDSSFARNISLRGGRNLQFRLDVFNLLNEARIAGRNTLMELSSPADPGTILNLPFDAQGNVIPARAVPKGAGFGVANVYQSPRTIQIQVRVTF